jgi:hypothetical protein
VPGIRLPYPLDLAGGIRRGIEATRADAETVAAASDQVRMVVVAAVTRAYMSTCSSNHPCSDATGAGNPARNPRRHPPSGRWRPRDGLRCQPRGDRRQSQCWQMPRQRWPPRAQRVERQVDLFLSLRGGWVQNDKTAQATR